jgi:thioredoxin 2
VTQTTVVQCRECGTKNRIANLASGRPRCSTCHSDLPWLVNIAGDEFAAVLSSSKLPVLVDLWAPWCGPCRSIAPLLEALAVDYAGKIRVVKVNVDEAPEVSANCGVQGIPTMMIYSGGVEVSRQVGALPGSALRAWVDSALTSA